ncbi:MAG: L,D-transpeptidase family protein [Rhodospirillales bacterium]
MVPPKTHLPPDGPRQGVVINLPEQRPYYYQNGRLANSYPIGIGRDGHATPVGTTTVARKTLNPVWRPTPSARADDPELPAMVPAGPDNPLGSRALYLGWSSYLIHGTNKEYSIGRRGSRGCIRMYEDDVRALYDHVAVGTQVTTLDQPVKVGWIGDQLYIEASPTIAQVRQWEEDKRFDPVSDAGVRDLVLRKAEQVHRPDRLDGGGLGGERRGIVTRITGPKRRQPSPAPHLLCSRAARLHLLTRASEAEQTPRPLPPSLR